MKLAKINDILVLTEQGENIEKRESIEITFSNLGSGNYLVVQRGSRLEEVGYFYITADDNVNHKCLVPSKIIKENDMYIVTLFEKTENKTERIAQGTFAVTDNVIRPHFDLCASEFQKLWKTIVYISDKLGIDEEALDTLVKGYITE